MKVLIVLLWEASRHPRATSIIRRDKATGRVSVERFRRTCAADADTRAEEGK